MNIIWLLLCLTIVENAPENVPECRVTFKFQKICHRYRIDDNCRPPHKIENCERLKTTYNDRKCPQHICVSIS